MSGERRPENLGKWAITGTSIVMQIGGMVNLKRAYQSLPPGTKVPVIPQFPYMSEKFLGKIKKA